MAHQITEMWLGFIAGKVFQRVVEISVKNCPGHHYKCPVLHRCQQLSLYEKLVMHFEQVRREIIEKLHNIFEEASTVLTYVESQRPGMITFARHYMESTTPEALYFGNVYRETLETLLYNEDSTEQVIDQTEEPIRITNNAKRGRPRKMQYNM